MSRSSGRTDRAQAEPLAALVAVLAVCIAVSAYAGVAADALPSPDRNVAEPTVERVSESVATGGVVRPARLPEALGVGPDGHRLNLTLTADGRTWSAGPHPPPTASSVGRTASVRVAPGRIRPGRLRVAVWS